MRCRSERIGTFFYGSAQKKDRPSPNSAAEFGCCILHHTIYHHHTQKFKPFDILTFLCVFAAFPLTPHTIFTQKKV